MKRILKMQGLDCANCAAKMEQGIGKLAGVEQVTISFMSQKMTLVAGDDLFEDVLAQAIQVCKKIEPDCQILR